jgi:hypothetical protein
MLQFELKRRTSFFEGWSRNPSAAISNSPYSATAGNQRLQSGLASSRARSRRLRPDQEPPKRPKHTIQGKKIIVTTAWNPFGFHLVHALPNSSSYNAEFYGDDILTALVQFLPEAGGRNLILHPDNVRCQTAQQCQRCWRRIGYGSPHSHVIHLISDDETSSSSGMSRIACMETSLPQTKNQ